MALIEASAGRIVLVADRPFAGTRLKRLLEIAGYDVRESGGFDGALAECLAGVAPASLVISLVEYRDESLAFLERARAARALDGISVVALAALAEIGDGRLRGRGIEAVVDVHAIPEELVFRINEALFAGRDLRRFARVFTNLPAHCSVDAASFEGRVTNLGQGGAFVRTEATVNAGSRVRFRVHMPGAVVVSGEAEVRFATQREPIGGSVKLSGMGLEFGRLDGNSQDSIARFVAEIQSEWRALLE